MIITNDFDNDFNDLVIITKDFKLELDRRYDFKASHCIKVLTKHFSRFNQLAERWMIAFLTWLLVKFINFLSWFFRFAHLRNWQYMSITKPSTFKERSWTPFSALKCANWQGKPTSKIFSRLVNFVFFEAGRYVVQP